MHFRLLTYNIHKGIGGVDRKYDLTRIIETIRSYEPDVALLQEVDDGVPRSSRHCQVDVLAAETGLSHCAFQRTVSLREGHYGNAILSRYPLDDTVEVDLTLRPKKRRGALIATWRLPTGSHTKTITLANVHLGLAGFERRMQMRRLLRGRHLASLRSRTPLVIAGDYNDVWDTLGRRILLSEGFQSSGPAIRTFPAAMPLRPLDRAYFRGDLRVVRTFAGHTQLARRASDHLPLVIEFEFTRK